MILGGLLVCLVLLALATTLLAVSGKWVALALMLTVLCGVVAATYVMTRPRGKQHRQLR